MYSFSGRVRYSECDETGRLSLASMVNYLQDCSTFQSEDLGIGFEHLAKIGVAWMLSTWTIEVDELPALRDQISVKTWCYDMTRSHALRCFAMENAQGEKIVRADSQWFVFDTRTGRPTRVPADQFAYRSDEPRLDMGPLDRRLATEGEGRPLEPVMVRPHSLDTNHHVNNAQYVQFAVDALSGIGERPDVRRLLVRYRKMARLGDVITPVAHRRERGWDVNLIDAQGEAYALVRLETR